MNIHYLQHVPFEGLGSMEAVFTARGHRITFTRLFANDAFPDTDQFDWLIVMGGPMGVHDSGQYHWIEKELQFIEQAVLSKKIILGICLGAQMIAHVLGAKVYQNQYREIGWFDIKRLPGADATMLADAIPGQLSAFHWHGETFDIPRGAVHIAESEACPNQGFIFEDHIAAFQFHLETTIESAGALVENCRSELDNSRFVQSEALILSDTEKFSRINTVMARVIDGLEKTASER